MRTTKILNTVAITVLLALLLLFPTDLIRTRTGNAAVSRTQLPSPQAQLPLTVVFGRNAGRVVLFPHDYRNRSQTPAELGEHAAELFHKETICKTMKPVSWCFDPVQRFRVNPSMCKRFRLYDPSPCTNERGWHVMCKCAAQRPYFLSDVIYRMEYGYETMTVAVFVQVRVQGLADESDDKIVTTWAQATPWCFGMQHRSREVLHVAEMHQSFEAAGVFDRQPRAGVVTVNTNPFAFIGFGSWMVHYGHSLELLTVALG